MIALFALALVAAQAPADANDIVVTARKLDSIRVTLDHDPQGRVTCGIDRSSGDERLDAAMCKQAAKCLPRAPLSAEKLDACLDRQRAGILAMMRKAEAA